jgi:Zn finger protein HypA/HybF involved in hydrogenase expression
MCKCKKCGEYFEAIETIDIDELSFPFCPFCGSFELEPVKDPMDDMFFE